MISFEKEDAKHFLRHLASATRRIQEREILKQKLTGQLGIGLATKPIEEKITELEAKLGRLEKIEKSFDVLNEKVSDYRDIKKEEERALEELRKPSRVDINPSRVGINEVRTRLKLLERKYNALKKKGHSKASLKRIKNRIDGSKKMLNSLKS